MSHASAGAPVLRIFSYLPNPRLAARLYLAKREAR